MKHLPLLFFLLLTPALPAQGQLSDAILAFDEGTALLEAGSYREALQRFSAADSAGFASAEMYYHQGIAHFRLDELGLAIRDFERALKLDPDNRFVAHSLTIARSKIEQPVSELPVPITVKIWRQATSNPNLLFWIGFVGYLVFLAARWARTRDRGRRDWVRRIMWTAGSGATLLIAVAFWASVSPSQGRSAVIVSPSTALRAQANPGADTIVGVSEGIAVTILSEEGQWLSVRLPNGVDGWIPADAAAEI